MFTQSVSRNFNFVDVLVLKEVGGRVSKLLRRHVVD